MCLIPSMFNKRHYYMVTFPDRRLHPPPHRSLVGRVDSRIPFVGRRVGQNNNKSSNHGRFTSFHWQMVSSVIQKLLEPREAKCIMIVIDYHNFLPVVPIKPKIPRRAFLLHIIRPRPHLFSEKGFSSP